MKAKRTPALLGLLSLAISILATSSSLAQMNYQGRLTDSTGENLTNGQYTIAFSMYDEAGVLKWGPYTTDGPANQGSGSRVEVFDGRFNTVIGNLDLTGRKLSEGFNGLEKRYLQIKVGNNPPITPRQLLLPAPIALYAPLAGHATTATSVGNGSGSSPLTVDFNSGNVGVGTSTPSKTLHVFDGNSQQPAHPSASLFLESSASNYLQINAPDTLEAGILFGRDSSSSSGGIIYQANKSLAFRVNDINHAVLTDTGRFGIGTMSPAATLEVASPSLSAAFQITETGAGGKSWQFYPRGDNLVMFTPGLRLVSFGTNGDAFFGGMSDDLGGGATLTVKRATQSVGIGTTGPNAKLHVSGAAAETALRVQVGGASKLIVDANGGLAVGSFVTPPANGLSVAGNVGIGTNTPTRAKLEVNGFESAVVNIGGYLTRDGAGDSSNSNRTSTISIFATNEIVGSVILAVSDARIKEIVGRSDASADLQTINRIEVTDYTFKDKIGKGNCPEKKVIAQQVEKVYPQAVRTITDVVPDIYEKATVKAGWITLATDLKVGERVRLIDEKSEAIHEVIETREGAFRTDFVGTGKKVFVYGREVDDFHLVDYEAIAMLNVSATQELHRQLQAKDKELTALQLRVAELEAKDKERDEKLIAIEKAIGSGIVPVSAQVGNPR